MVTPKRQKAANGISHALDDSDPMASLKAKLQMADLEIQNFIAALEAENLKLQKQISKLRKTSPGR